jgi:peptidoglycan LD-endopeptidase CwlK
MPNFSASSLDKLKTCHPDLQKIFNEVIKHYDCTIIQGARSAEEQAELFRQGKSKIAAGGKHNSTPSMAVDVAPCPINWGDKMAFYHFAGFVLGVAAAFNINVRWGGDWDGDRNLKNQTFFDLPHFELVD